MARKPATVWGAKRHKPIPYRRLEKFLDRWKGKADGRRGIPALPATPAQAPDHPVVTPYLVTLKQHFRVAAENEHSRMIEDLAEPSRQQQTLRQQITDAEERLAGIRAW
jgi:hypothetical protein